MVEWLQFKKKWIHKDMICEGKRTYLSPDSPHLQTHPCKQYCDISSHRIYLGLQIRRELCFVACAYQSIIATNQQRR